LLAEYPHRDGDGQSVIEAVNHVLILSLEQLRPINPCTRDPASRRNFI
jgi:hypothetical protein